MYYFIVEGFRCLSGDISLDTMMANVKQNIEADEERREKMTAMMRSFEVALHPSSRYPSRKPSELSNETYSRDGKALGIGFG